MDTPLVRADAMRGILAHFQVDVNQADEDGDTLLHTAAREGNTSMVAALLAMGGVDRADAAEDYALHEAVVHGYVEVARLLIDAGGDANVVDADSYTPLHLAAYDGHVEIGRLLIAAGADIHYEDRCGCTPVFHTTYEDRAEVARLLLEAGARTDVKDEDGEGVLHKAALYGANETIKCLLSFGAEVNVMTDSARPWTPLYYALQAGTRRTLALLLGAGAIVDLDNLKDLPRDMNPDGSTTSSRKHRRSAWRYIDKVVAAGGYENLVRTYRRVLTAPRGCLTRYLRQRFGRDAPHDVAARVLEFWKPPGGP